MFITAQGWWDYSISFKKKYPSIKFTCRIDEFKYFSSPSINSLILLLCKRIFDSSFLTALLGSSHSTPPDVISIPRKGLQVNYVLSFWLSFEVISVLKWPQLVSLLWIGATDILIPSKLSKASLKCWWGVNSEPFSTLMDRGEDPRSQCNRLTVKTNLICSVALWIE